METCERKLLRAMKKKYYLLDSNPKVFDGISTAEYRLLKDLSSIKSKVGGDTDKPIRFSTNSIFVDDTFQLNDKSTYFSFTEPIISLKKFRNTFEFQRNYHTLEPGDRLFIWLTLNREGAEHIVCHIQTKDNRNFSFGFGYFGDLGPTARSSRTMYTQARDVLTMLSVGMLHETERHAGALYTPDYLFERRVRDQITKPSGTFIKLVASSLLTPEHIQIMSARFDQITNLRSLLFVSLQQVRKKEPIYYMSNYIKFDDMEYCSWTGAGVSGETNCAGFIEILFRDVLSCPGGLFSRRYNPDPETCMQISDIVPCDDMVLNETPSQKNKSSSRTLSSLSRGRTAQGTMLFKFLSKKVSKSRKTSRKSLRKSPRKIMRKTLRKSPRKIMRKTLRKSLRKSQRKVMRKSLRKSQRKVMRKSLRKSPRKTLRKYFF